MSKLWFKRRRYGYGWVPVTWQGFLTLFIYIGIILAVAFIMDDDMGLGELFAFFVFVVIATLLLVTVSLFYGPKPKWRWGKSPDDNPKEDF